MTRYSSTAASSNAPKPPTGAGEGRLEIAFPIEAVRALLATHVYFDQVGLIPYLLAVGLKCPIYWSEASAQLSAMVREDALKVGFTQDKAFIGRMLMQLKKQIITWPYKAWFLVIKADAANPANPSQRLRLEHASHNLGSAYPSMEQR